MPDCAENEKGRQEPKPKDQSSFTLRARRDTGNPSTVRLARDWLLIDQRGINAGMATGLDKAKLQSFAAILASLIVAAAIGWAGSEKSVAAFGVPLFALCGAFSFGINWLVFIPAYALQTERYFDLTGTLTYLSLTACALVLNPGTDARGTLIALLIAVWAVRLGTFLFRRISRDGSDGRFDAIKPDFPWFLMTWTLQGLWVFLTLSCGLAALTSETRVQLGLTGGLGALLWLAGFALETTADRQKQAFRADPANRDRFITSGLWAWSRHPNYAGEILLWAGVALISLPVLSGWQYATLISPVFVYVLLTRISGIPMLESRAKRKWGTDPAYRAYKARTPALMLRPPRIE